MEDGECGRRIDRDQESIGNLPDFWLMEDEWEEWAKTHHGSRFQVWVDGAGGHLEF